MADCPGRDGTWPCALSFGHEGDHSRFSESTLTAFQLELVNGFQNLRDERDELLLTCADLLAALKEIEARMCDKPLCGHFTTEEIREVTAAAIKKAETR